jgi:hypothetical protein
MTANTHIETIVSLPIYNPDTGRASRTFRYQGRVDLVEGTRLVDWKSARDPQRFIKTKRIGFQAELYTLALRSQGVNITEHEYRIVGTPSLQLVKKTDLGYEYTRKYGGDLGLYEDTCYNWIIDDPGKMISHVKAVDAGRLKQAQAYLWECGKRILENRNAERWLPNEQACYSWERECEYMPLCEAVAGCADLAGQIDLLYEKSEPHPELNGHGKDPNTLTYSSLGVLTLCELKYFWKYEQSLRRRNDFSEPLWTGSAMHAGLEAYSKDGLAAGLRGVQEWAEHNPIITENAALYQEQLICKARAMVRAAAEKWGA